MMDLNTLWFLLIVVLFTGFFFLEGFDYGVGALTPFLSPHDRDRSIFLRTITPVWDGNEVWMITAGGALFAAFPHVYSTMFATFYLALFLMLFALILRGVAFDFRARYDAPCWRHGWEAAIAFGSVVPAFLWGVAITNLIAGIAINEKMIYTGGFFDLLTPYTVVGGMTFLFVFLFHGASFLSFRVVDFGLVRRAQQLGIKLGTIAALLFVLCMAMTLQYTDLFHSTLAAVALIAAAVIFVIGIASLAKGNGKPAFVCSSLAIVLTTVAFFAGLFPRLMVSSLNPAWSLTITNASSTPYTLSIMTVAACIFVPIVLIYQCWSYYIFRKRITEKDAEEHY